MELVKVKVSLPDIFFRRAEALLIKYPADMSIAQQIVAAWIADVIRVHPILLSEPSIQEYMQWINNLKGMSSN